MNDSETEDADKGNDDEEETADDQQKEEESDSSGEDEQPSSEEDDSSESLKEDKKNHNISMYSTSNTVLKKGMRDQKVVTLKKDLEKLDFKVPGNGTTYYGKDTEAKVKEFQSYYGLTADGIAGPATFNKIDSILDSPLQKGKRHKDTVTLKQNLSFVGLPVPGNETTYFGSGTEKRVKEFQKKHNLAVNGIADKVTLRKLDELAVPVLKEGIRHNDVVQLKKDLKRLGFEVPGNGTTYFGSKTKEKVQEFQRYYGLSADGIAGNDTLNKITFVLNSPLQKGKRHKDTIQLKKDLANIGFKVPGNGTNLYGTKTESTVKQFQKENNLAVSGIAEEVTLKKIQDLQSTDLKNGVRHPDVVTLKKKLAKVGFKVPGNGTSYFGPDTEKTVKNFQSYYGLNKNGVVDSKTSKKLDAVVNSPFQSGERHPRTPKLKADLGTLGFIVPGNGTTYYGSGTKKQVKAFQKEHGLVQNGIADEVTLNKINELAPDSNVTLRKGDRHPQVITLKQNLEKLGFKVPGNGTNYFGSKTKQKVKEFQSYYGLGADGVAGKQTFEKITSILSSPLQEGVSHSDTVKLKKDLASLGFKVPGNGTKLYGEKTAEKVREFQKKYGLAINGIADEVTLETIQVLLEANFTEEKYNITLDQAVSMQMKVNPQTDKSGRWAKASAGDVKYYLDYRNFLSTKKEMLQFLDLSKPAGVPASVLNKHLNGAGTLDGKASAFIDGAKKYNINEAYLVSHAKLETGNGNSKLAKGVEVGLNSKGNPTLVTKKNKKKLKNIKTTYNMYGIGANDSDPVRLGAIRAYEEGWFTPTKAIIGGAKFVGQKYIHANPQQNTLYKMRWNPESMERNSYASHQYATDIGWANKQTATLHAIYKDLDVNMFHLELPSYK